MSQPKEFKLKRGHGWKSKPGHSICVLDRGAVRLEFPSTWIVKQRPDSVQIHDSEPPDNDCVLGVSRFQAPEGSEHIAMRDVVNAALAGDEREILESRETVEVQRPDVEIAWKEVRYFEPEQKREAFSRLAVARGAGVYCLLTFDFWTDQSAEFAPVWDNVLRSLELGVYVDDPSVGPLIQ